MDLLIPGAAREEIFSETSLFSTISFFFHPPRYDHRGAGWFAFLVFHFFLILSLDLGVTLCFFDTNGFDDSMFLWGFSYRVFLFFFHLHSRPPFLFHFSS